MDFKGLHPIPAIEGVQQVWMSPLPLLPLLPRGQYADTAATKVLAASPAFWTLKLLSEVSEIGVYNRTRKIKYIMKFKKSLDLLSHYSLCGPCLLSHRRELISLALGNEGYFDAERERLLGS